MSNVRFVKRIERSIIVHQRPSDVSINRVVLLVLAERKVVGKTEKITPKWPRLSEELRSRPAVIQCGCSSRPRRIFPRRVCTGSSSGSSVRLFIIIFIVIIFSVNITLKAEIEGERVTPHPRVRSPRCSRKVSYRNKLLFTGNTEFIYTLKHNIYIYVYQLFVRLY